ncbi:28S ribosomal protein S15, mitochondrial [Coccinella septempunctata]|uniref:28S ribosomal protein S15, mitochondrial n=1 Tax=Coccinella septempunctata TaxID=41139 RepID=UPI001D06F96A|nr:28S ribosomal protein S15, mitochondrial [Coccinella septempunctata]
MNQGFKFLRLLSQNNPVSNSQIRNYAFKSNLKIKWVRPAKIPCFVPEKSGDLEGLPQIDKTQIRDEFKHCHELETANELVKKLFTYEFAPRRSTVAHVIKSTADRVRRHKNDNGSHEVTIAKWTGVIRAWQETMERFPRNTRLKVHLKELIDRRKKYLKYLRRWDYKRFEWVLDNLNLKYKPMPLDVHWVTRKDSLRKLTDKYCEDLKKEKLDKLKLQLEAEQPAFLEEKIRCLEFIRDEEKACGIETTINQVEIDDVKLKLEVLQKRNMERKKELEEMDL